MIADLCHLINDINDSCYAEIHQMDVTVGIVGHVTGSYIM